MLYVDESAMVERLASDTCVIDATALLTFAAHHVATTTTATKQSKSCVLPLQ
jgi:ribosomal silencing factor RsfS